VEPLHTLIGLKRLDDAKTRLAPDVSPQARRELMLTMLRHVVEAARDAGLGPVALATSEVTAPELARGLGVAVLSDAGLPWNEGLVHALRTITPTPGAVLFLAGDLPLLAPGDLTELADAAPRPGVCIARARDGGTNALLVTPSHAMAPGFGVRNSSEVHRRAATLLGLRCRVIDMPGLALDVDTVEDAWDAGVLARPVSETGRGSARG
jgi:2-phospho-L-lactate guanylyltransferase